MKGLSGELGQLIGERASSSLRARAGSETAVRETAAREPPSSASVLLPLAEGREALPGIRRFGCAIG